jgi:2,5-furandicarboxylate decarboxylase 1
MPFDSLREYLRVLEDQGELQRIYKEVDRDVEISAVLKRAGEQAIWCERVRGFDIPVVSNVFHGRQKMATALGTSPDRMLWEYIDRAAQPIPPRVVPDGPVHEVVWTGDEVDLGRLPIPRVHPDDGGRFISAGLIVARDPEFGTNISIQRLQHKGPATTGILIGRVQHLNVYHQRAEARNEPLPIAVVIGCDPTVYLASQMKPDIRVDEYTLAGGLRRAPVDVVQCRTVDLQVPAGAEIVLEGYIPPHVREPEGPFGEFPGYYGFGEDPESPVVHYTAITMRRDALFQSIYLGKPPTENNYLTFLPRTSLLYQLIKPAVAEIQDIYVSPGGCSNFTAVISIRQRYAGEAKLALAAALSSRMALKHVVVVDDDIDIHNPIEVEWAMATRAQFDQDLITVPNAPAGLDPSAEPKRGNHLNYRIGIDATKPYGKPFPAVCDVPAEMVAEVDRNWAEYITAPEPRAAGTAVSV